MHRLIIPALVSLLLSPAAQADWSLVLEGLTDVPVQAGAKVTLEFPFRLQLSTSVGAMPGSYVDLINAVVVSADGYDQQTADLVSDALQNSLVWRLHLGFRPLADYGWYLAFGYGLVALGGGLSNEDVVVLATGEAPPALGSGETRSYSVSSRLHMLDGEVGWCFMLWEGLTLRLALGFSGTVSASAKVNPDYPVLIPQVVEAFTRPAERYLVDVYEKYVFTPTVSVGLGWKFF